jgi:hypothetical protein
MVLQIDLRIPSLHHLLISELALNNNHSLTHFSGILFYLFQVHLYLLGGCCGRDRMVVGFTTTCAISAYHH